jgi:4-diphosphocytidyl-2-C-methyl-D-erythritol kinase
LRLAVPARAKLNLDLEVIGRRPDGYHDLRTTMQTVELHDLLLIEPATTQTTLTTSGLSVPNRDHDNSVLQAHAALERAAHRTLPAAFHLEKRIPPGSGMGGASSDAAAALQGLKQLFKLELEIDLGAIAAESGSDVPFFLHGGAALVEGRGEKVTPIATTPSWFAIAWPGIELSTQSVYQAWDEVGGKDLRHAAEHVEPRLKDFATMLGAGWTMTGSGSAFFRAAATENEARVAIRGLDCWTAVTRAIDRW